MGTTPTQARDRLARLLRLVRGGRRAVIAAQDRPDPDGMASAAALKHLLQHKTRLDVVIAASGESGRAENRATLQLLGEPLEDLDALDLAAFDLRILVDTQPGFGNNSWPPHVPVHIVFDHHPRGQGIEPGQVADIRPDYGAASTIMTEYLRAAALEPPHQLATALLYGIKTDTQDLTRGASPADSEAFLYLYPRANHRLLAKIERERLPRTYFANLAHALLRCRLYDSVAICAFGPVESPDVLSEMADLFLRIEGVRWVLCHGIYDHQLHLSARTVLRRGTAGDVMNALLDGIGEGGGHDMMAGGQADLPADGQMDDMCREIELKFLRALDIQSRTPEPLVPNPPAPAPPAPQAQAAPHEQPPPPAAQ